MPGKDTHRPLVTFALFAYNQEQYICEAVEGAFAQTYEPLEIILSDDSSSDRTYEIMQEMASAYRGNARIILRRSPANRGLALHMQDVTNLSHGDFMVVSAGDDISLPERTTELIRQMLHESTQFAASNYTEISESGKILNENLCNDYSENYIWQVIDSSPDYFANGAAACYRVDFLRGAFASAKKAMETGKINNEDMLFAAYAVALDAKPSNYTTDALLLYRINSDSLSNFRRTSNNLRGELSLVQRETFRSASRLACLSGINEIASSYPKLQSRLKKERIKHDMRRAEVELLASNKKFSRRIAALRKAHNFNELKIIAPRLLGQRTLAAMRLFRKNLSRVSIKRKLE
jgi:glycosyltransferase involved in cell wall biosynthesis